jgi:hypothetical protein
MAGSRLSEPSGVEGDGEREHAVVDEEDMEVEGECYLGGGMEMRSGAIIV